MSLQDITITASINSYPTLSYGQKTYIASTDNQSFPIETITGSQAGVWSNFVEGTNYTVDLFVNITQSWSGSNVTPLGIVPYIHNTNDEFFNGEFSGSNYVVTDGDLNDTQCEQFLTVSTTPVSYKVFGFFKNSFQDPFGVYLNRETAPLNGEIYIYWDNFSGAQTKGIYAKISRVDALGNNNTLSLQELKQFSYTDTAAGKIIFNVVNITEYSTFYFYEVTTNTTTSVPTDDNFYLHALSVSYTASTLPSTPLAFGVPVISTILSSSNGNWTEIVDSLNEFIGGKYTFGDTPNIQLQFTSSFKFTTSVTTTVGFGIAEWSPTDIYNNSLIPSTYITGTSSISLPAGTYNWKITGSGFFNSVKNYVASIVYGSDQTITNITASFIITQSQSPESSTNNFVIEPYLLSTFAGSDCDVLLNNYSENDYSRFYREVLYDDGGTTPSNLKQIVSGTAQFAEINDYLYNASANTLPRYNGVRTTSPDFNQYSVDGLSNEELANFNKGNNYTVFTSYPLFKNGVINVEQTTTYFAYFTSLKSNNPIFKNTTSPIIKYLIREDGEIFTPSTDESAFYNLQGSFETSKKATVTLLNNNSIIFNDTKSILLSGESYTPILYSLNATNGIIATFTSSLGFDNLQGVTSTAVSPVSYSFYASKSNPPYQISLTDGLSHNVFYGGVDTTNYFSPGAGTWSGGPTYFSSNVYEPYYDFTGTPSVSVKVTFIVDRFRVGDSDSGTLILELWKSNSGISSSMNRSAIGPLPGRYGNGNLYGAWNLVGSSLHVLTTTFSPAAGDSIFAIVRGVGVGAGSYASNVSLKIETLGISVPSIDGPFWFTGSANSNTITSSVSLGSVLLGNYQQIDIPNSGFDPIQLPCEIKIGDEIRFEYDESYSYRIIDTGISTNGEILLTLDDNIPTISTLNINHFTVRRKIKDAITGITLDANLISTIDEGFLFPEYPSETIKRDLPKIINDLSEKNII